MERFHVADVDEGSLYDGFNNIEDAVDCMREVMHEYDKSAEDLVILETYGTLLVKDSVKRITHTK